MKSNLDILKELLAELLPERARLAKEDRKFLESLAYKMHIQTRFTCTQDQIDQLERIKGEL